jgi:hypothetical protein
MTIYPKRTTDPKQLRNLMDNAKRLGRQDVYAAALQRLCEVLPGSNQTDAPDPIMQRFWKAVHAAEELKTELNGRTTRLSRTRQKLARDGVITTMEDLALKPKPGERFMLLVGHGLSELVFEYIILDYPSAFSACAVDAARKRLLEYGVAPPS